MTKHDVKRYIEQEVADIGMLENEVSEVVCFREGCDRRIDVDPVTLVVEDQEAVETIAEVATGPKAETERKRVEVYCSPECRIKRYSNQERELCD